MPFRLIVEFSGPCLYVIDGPSTKDGQKFADRLGVVIPDCTLPSDSKKPNHKDEEPAEPHVGYLRIDMADVDARFPRAEEDGNPLYELVHRFTGQVLNFIETHTEERGEGGSTEEAEEGEQANDSSDPLKTHPGASEQGDGTEGDGQLDRSANPVNITGLNVPEFEQFAPGLALEDNLFNSDAKILARMVLEGGGFTSEDGPDWRFTRELNPQEKAHEGRFASFLTWTRDYAGTGLTIQITSLAGEPEVTIPLTIEEGAEIHMTVANLCALNPLDWGEFEKPKTPRVDEDFKWLYQLFKDVPKGIHLPAPRLVKAADGETGDNGCMGGTKTGSTG